MEIVNGSEIALPAFADRWKRVFEFCVASIVLIVLRVPMVIIAIIVKTTSPGPALLGQKRYGVHRQPIEVLKFRSMTVHADGEVKQATKNATRVIAIGKIIRRTSLLEAT